MGFWNLILQQVKWNLWKVTQYCVRNRTEWNENKMKEKHQDIQRNAISNSMEPKGMCGECMCFYFVSVLFFEPTEQRCLQNTHIYMCVYAVCLYLLLPHVYSFFLSFDWKKNTKQRRKKNLTKCILLLFILSGYNIVTWIWWEILFSLGREWESEIKGT